MTAMTTASSTRLGAEGAGGPVREPGAEAMSATGPARPDTPPGTEAAPPIFTARGLANV